MSSESLEERSLIKLLGKFDRFTQIDFVQKTQELAERFGPAEVETITDAETKEPISLRIHFSSPLFVLLSHPICRLHKFTNYAIGLDWRRYFVAQLQMIPIYCVSLNTLSVVKFWGDKARSYSRGFLEQAIDYDGTPYRMQPTSRNIVFSNLNFIIPFGAELYRIPPSLNHLSNALEMYFKYAYWSKTGKGFTYSTHLIHDKHSIQYEVRVIKAVALMENLRDGWKTRWRGRSLDSTVCDVRVVLNKGGSVGTEIYRNVYLPDDIAKLLRDESDANERFFNCVILDIFAGAEESQSLKLVSVVPEAGGTQIELVKAALSMLLIQKYLMKAGPTMVATREELQSELHNFISQVARTIRLPHTLGDEAFRGSFTDLMAQSLADLFPLFTVNAKGEVYFLHPLLLGFLFEENRVDMLSPEGYKDLQEFLQLVQEMEQKRQLWRYYSAPVLKTFRRNGPEMVARLAIIRSKVLAAKQFEQFENHEVSI